MNIVYFVMEQVWIYNYFSRIERKI